MAAGLLLEWAPKGTLVNGAFERVLGAFPRRVTRMDHRELDGNSFRLRVWSHPLSRTHGFLEDATTGSWLVVVGNPTRTDLVALDGEALLRRLLGECLHEGVRVLDSLSPPFAAVFYDGRSGLAHVGVDRFGFQHLYVRAGQGASTWISSSALPLAQSLPAKVDLHHVAEWLAMGHFMSDRTLVREVRKLGCGERLRLDPDGQAATESRWEPSVRYPEPLPREDAIEPFIETFLESLDATARTPGLATEMTGGIDSRFLLAAILAHRIPALAWTLGQPGWSELHTIERLRQRVPFSHRVVAIDERLVPRLPSLVQEMQELSDGEANALEYAPLLSAFEQLEGHRTTSLSGVAGEIARGFYFGLLRSPRQTRGVPIEALLAKETRPAAQARNCFSREIAIDPLAELRAVVDDFVNRSPAATPEGILEDLYLRARLQRFAGRNFTTTGYFCRQGLPYFGHRFVEMVLRLPFETKRDGWIIRKSLMRLSPELSSVPLVAGMAVPPSSWLRPDRIIRRYSALARRAAAKYGGNLGRRLAVSGPEMVPWDVARADPSFREFVHELLLTPHAQTASFLERERVSGVVSTSLGGGSLYPLGLLVTLELTLRQIARGGK